VAFLKETDNLATIHAWIWRTTNSKYFIKNNSITPSVEKGKVIDCRKSNVTLANYYYSWQEKLPTRLTRIVSHQWFSKCSLLLHQEKRSTENTGNPNSGF